MGFVESLRSIIYDILHNLDRIHVDLIKSNGLNPLRIRHDSGGLLEFRNDSKVYYNGTEIVTSSGGISDHNLLNNITWSTAGHTINTDVDMDANSLDNIWNANFYATSGGDGKIHWVYNSEVGNYFDVREITGNALATFAMGQGYATSFQTVDSSLNPHNLDIYGNIIKGPSQIRSHYTGTMQIISDHLTNPDVIEFEFANGVDMKVGNEMSFQDLYYIKNLKDPVNNQDGATKKYVDDHVGGLANIVEDTTPQLGGDLDCNTKKITGVTEIQTTTSILFKKV